MIHRCFELEDAEDKRIGDFVKYKHSDQLYIIVDILHERVKAIKHDGVVH